MSEWISIAERMPTEDDGEVLVYLPTLKMLSIAWATYWHPSLKFNKWSYQNPEDECDAVTHWMPLPEPPTK